MDGFKVTPTYIMGAAANCRTTADEVYSELNTLRSYVDGLGATWLGVTATKFQTLMEELRTDALQIHEALEGIAGILESNAANYIAAEEGNAAGIPTLN